MEVWLSLRKACFGKVWYDSLCAQFFLGASTRKNSNLTVQVFPSWRNYSYQVGKHWMDGMKHEVIAIFFGAEVQIHYPSQRNLSSLFLFVGGKFTKTQIHSLAQCLMFGCGDNTTPTACTSNFSRSKNHPRHCFEDSKQSLQALHAWAVASKLIIRNRAFFSQNQRLHPKNGWDLFSNFKFQRKRFGVHFSPILGGLCQLQCFFVFPGKTARSPGLKVRFPLQKMPSLVCCFCFFPYNFWSLSIPKKINPTRIQPTKSGWWFEPIRKICSSNWIISLGIGVKITNV